MEDGLDCFRSVGMEVDRDEEVNEDGGCCCSFCFPVSQYSSL